MSMPLSNDNLDLTSQITFDGDVLFAVTTNEVEPGQIDDMLLGMLAAELTWDAVLCSFLE